ncbi:DUF2752 domain-containing protein [Amycolatopsis sp. H20-H5]|uniref:DUF2752 domain-containing protein n=1 Tax=Amycolatopsis sp. H20-H5 TaxID=3046309 RepID=UPI002DBC9799|nr:DUF2752 domain-containing protein [Amycolatopsis sp. H20-H5]MEC3977209.1 DUF2752 domain-containing protein [Amycolatopsis sp. H20-H5]
MTTVYTGVPARGWRARSRALVPPLAVVAGAGVCCAAVWLADPTTPGGPSPVCPTKLLFGIDCPGCGGLRMAYSLLHGDIPAALHYNAVSLVVVLLFVWSTAAWTAGRLRGRAVSSWLHWRRTPLVFAVVFALWFVVRNLPFAPFTGLFV